MISSALIVKSFGLRDRVLTWLFHKLFGKLDIRAEIYTTETFILVAELVVVTRFGEFTFPFLNKQLPIPSVGSTDTFRAIALDDESADTRPA